MTGSDDFYVGYAERAPAALAGAIRARALLALVLVLAVAATIVMTQGPADPGVFEFGTTRTVDGVVLERPHPTLLVERPGGGTSAWLLSVFGKHGAEAMVAGLDGRRVRATGTLAYRGDTTMLELADDGLEPLGDAPSDALMAAATATVDLGEHAFDGEIVDSKCYLGVMKPGRGKPHKACAVRCISGGMPPLLLVRGEQGEASSLLLLTDADGAPVNDRVLDVVAEPVRVRGRLLRTGDRLVLRADPAAITRVP